MTTNRYKPAYNLEGWHFIGCWEIPGGQQVPEEFRSQVNFVTSHLAGQILDWTEIWVTDRAVLPAFWDWFRANIGEPFPGSSFHHFGPFTRASESDIRSRANRGAVQPFKDLPVE